MNLAGMFLPIKYSGGDETEEKWPDLNIDSLPPEIQNVLNRTPRAYIDSDGYLFINNSDQKSFEVPLAPTQWNLEHNKTYHRLVGDKPWGIVLHWYGDKENFDHSLKGYLRGFDSLRQVEDYIVQTSAHFLIGDEAPLLKQDQQKDRIAIIQTQAPDRDGTPYVASHLRSLDIQAHRERKQYFVRAYYQLATRDASVHSLLQEMFDGPHLDPNRRTIAIEIAGFNFDQPDYYPGDQKLANSLGTVWAIMRRYHIPACNILGHHEIQLGKADPGKKLMATIRFLLGIKALVEADPIMYALVFGQFLGGTGDRDAAVARYFNNVYNFATLVGSRRSIYEWEIWSKYWLVMKVMDRRKNIHLAKQLRLPLSKSTSLDGNGYLNPQSHEGVDFYIRDNTANRAVSPAYPALLIGDGQCLYHGKRSHCGHGSSAIFRHYRTDGSEILSVYEQLSESVELVTGKYYPLGFPLGKIKAHRAYQYPYLHFALAYGSCWELDLKTMSHPPLNAGLSWISERYMEPLAFFEKLQS